ncbi:type II toxin-antitoxin system PemK/MazF family toxin [Microbacterium sp.]|uniref:type II toxin-antitoxin system PemK/MazF family toxin n=1 Tax=Microbacterium sp. TaxID=51671 RepID=UPI002619D1AC|nr:type II toxin-antitoxin system PemK/MazF family toxin [Microbacterium sp.]
MTSSRNILRQLAGLVVKALSSGSSRSPERGPGRSRASDTEVTAGREWGSETVQIEPERIDDLQVSYTPSRDGAPDSGEVIWTWVPYEENDGRGKDRPVLVIGRHSSERVYAVRMTSKPHHRDRDYISIGSGSWDSQGRESWVDIEQLYSVHDAGMRREAAILDRVRYDRVADALVARYGWARR